jgi:hypothetical protein
MTIAGSARSASVQSQAGESSNRLVQPMTTWSSVNTQAGELGSVGSLSGEPLGSVLPTGHAPLQHPGRSGMD